MPEYHFMSEPNASPEDQQRIRDEIYRYNMEKLNDSNYSALSIFVRDDAGQIVGGILGDIWGGWLHITYLWVMPELREHGYGSRLLQAAEDEARSKGCRGAFLETHSFQVPAFYRKRGFLPVGQLDDYPAGHSFFIMWKPL